MLIRALPLFGVLLLPTTGSSQSVDILRNIGPIAVGVEAMRPNAERDGLPQVMLQTAVGLRLRQRGIPVEDLKTAVENSQPILYVVVATLKSDNKYAYCVRIQLRQRVSLSQGNLSHLYWERTKTGMINESDLRDVMNTVLDFVDLFCNDYLWVNP